MTTWTAFFLFASSMCLVAVICVLLYCLDRIGKMLSDINRISREIRRTAVTLLPLDMPNKENDHSEVIVRHGWNENAEGTD